MLRKLVKKILLKTKNQFELESLLVGNLMNVPESFKRKQIKYIEKKQNKDGGFSGRLGFSDIYYTAFAVRVMSALRAGDKKFWNRVSSFAKGFDLNSADLAGLVSFLQLMDILEKKNAIKVKEEYRRAAKEILKRYEKKDGGYMKSPFDKTMSIYNSFLAMLCLSKLGDKYPESNKASSKLLKRQTDDGGFTELGIKLNGQTNPSAAAVMMLFAFDALSQRAKEKAAGFFVRMQDSSGGFFAHEKAPMPDLLSTYTTLLTLKAIGESKSVDREAARKFVDSLADKNGGFKGVEVDNATDIEYTYYGLGCLGIIR